ncbi:hypothetical protein [Methylobacterium sp. WL120]|uniref:hypothetical protein n=1 Tax=Methylobacterium sp. WL120 TaxID=2603887 RepID=UPI0011CC321E|nr:hypothetical protein [Methylobacterium sp. WL120]TXM67248.1 hypothetical protein FV229_10575 [Methylobacterium sp. WL120]
MKTLCTVLAVSLTTISSVAPAFAQPYGGRDYGYDRREDGYRDRDREYGGRDDRRRDDDRRGYGAEDRGRGGVASFDEREYLRCNPDVLRAIQSGKMKSAAAHYQAFGRREGRRLSC